MIERLVEGKVVELPRDAADAETLSEALSFADISQMDPTDPSWRQELREPEPDAPYGSAEPDMERVPEF